MNKSLRQVKEFHQCFKHPIGNLDRIEKRETRQLRIRLLFEELAELAEAGDVVYTFAELCEEYSDTTFVDKDGDNVNQLEELDALCDIQYVLNGKILTGGYHRIFDHNFDLVHSNNMAKLHTNMEHVSETVSVKNMGSYQLRKTRKGIALYDQFGKTIKPHDHSKVSLTLNPNDNDTGSTTSIS